MPPSWKDRFQGRFQGKSRQGGAPSGDSTSGNGTSENSVFGRSAQGTFRQGTFRQGGGLTTERFAKGYLARGRPARGRGCSSTPGAITPDWACRRRRPRRASPRPIAARRGWCIPTFRLPATPSAFMELKQAYDVLIHADRRAAYDRLAEQEAGGRGPNGTRGATHGPNPEGGQGSAGARPAGKRSGNRGRSARCRSPT